MLSNNRFKTGRVIVSLCKKCTYPYVPICKEDAPYKEIDAERIEIIFRPQAINNHSEIGAVVLVYLKCLEPETVMHAIEVLLKNPCVISAEPDYFIGSHAIPNDRYFGYLWGMRNIKSPQAWDYTTGSLDVAVGVLDSGIDYNHPDIQGNLWIALSEQNLFDAGIGQVHDSPIDETGHGTHVAGTIGAVGNNLIGVTGVCWKVKLVSLKIGSSFFNLAAAIKAIDFANRNNIPILNNSWGSVIYSASLKFAIDHYDGLFVVSAGNSSTDNDAFPVYPASFDCKNIISVAAVDRNNMLASFSNYGALSVDIAAPGADIFSTDILGGYSYMDGTSMAAPHVAGAAALLKGYRRDLSPLDIKNVILSSVDRHANLFGKILTGGTLNLYKMIDAANIRL